jgi:hypothetical protein
VYLLFGCVPLLVITGVIEGFVSPSQVLPLWVKLLVALTSGVLLYSYLLLAGRSDPDATDAPQSAYSMGSGGSSS